MNAEVYELRPEGFQPSVEVAACYLEIDGRLLLLESGAHKPEAGKWGVPAGKVKRGEASPDAARRELFEETGIRVDSDSIHHLGSLYIRKPDLDYVYHLFKIALHERPDVQLSHEHSNFL